MEKIKTLPNTYFFCGIGGSGMMPLACILNAQGHNICGSDRARDQGNSPDKFEALERAGIKLFPQNGIGLTDNVDVLVTSTAVEARIPDVKVALDKNIPILSRAECLAELFHKSKISVGVSGTSGKTTVTGMLATVLAEMDVDPTVMNGGQVINLQSNNIGGNFLIGDSNVFVSEMDESDGSIDLFTPSIALVNNITIDHKPLDELKAHFQRFINRATKASIVNSDDDHAKSLRLPSNALTFSLADKPATFTADKIKLEESSVTFDIDGETVQLNVPGEHNVSNALAVLSVVKALDLDFTQACKALSSFKGIKRRMETVGVRNGVKVIDDFGHNPDKIAAGLKTVKQTGARILVMFQPHGYTPLRLMGDEILESFSGYFTDGDILMMPEVYYAGGTVDRSVTAKDIIAKAKGLKLNAHWFEKRENIKDFIIDNAHSGDVVMIMGARDDTLSDFAKDILEAL